MISVLHRPNWLDIAEKFRSLALMSECNMIKNALCPCEFLIDKLGPIDYSHAYRVMHEICGPSSPLMFLTENWERDITMLCFFRDCEFFATKLAANRALDMLGENQ